ncbi:Sodium-dependent transporter, SNF family [hydrothermal vent metagenome]|uniref:Sodium-dependent transporter, SNF family n=1 Tax=hydrothermal vent metagenome TaxID=652676 RepID=A0A3B0RIP8_9ZZZZ
MGAGQKTEQWSSRTGFLMAAIGFSVGLGNIWRFPYIMGENGGAAFLIIYLACALLIALPLLVSELAIGRRGRGSPVASMLNVAAEAGASPHWKALGGLAVVGIFVIMSYYTVIAGWTFDYFFLSITGKFNNISSAESGDMFAALTGSPLRLLFWHSVVNILVVLILRRGVQAGIEKAVNFLIPALFLCLIIMVLYAIIAGDLAKTAKFLLEPDFSKVTVKTVMVAVGQAFFSIGVGMASLITFGSYLNKDVSLPKSGAIIILADTGVALLAGFAIFPLVFAFGLTPSEGPGLIFQTLPVAFGQMPGGQIFGAVFFFLLIAAALTSCIGGLESVIAWIDEHKGIERKKGSIIVVVAAWLLGFFSILSFNEWSDFHPLGFIPAFAERTIFDTLDFFAANILLLVGGLLTSIFIGWLVPKKIQQEAIGVKGGAFYSFWRIIVRYIVPPLLLVILIMGLI